MKKWSALNHLTWRWIALKLNNKSRLLFFAMVYDEDYKTSSIAIQFPIWQAYILLSKDLGKATKMQTKQSEETYIGEGIVLYYECNNCRTLSTASFWKMMHWSFLFKFCLLCMFPVWRQKCLFLKKERLFSQIV